MTNGPLVSYAQNREDVVLWRALGDVQRGSYIDVGAWDADVHSVTRAFYDRGWRGINVEPVPRQAAAIREKRPADETIEAAVSATDGGLRFFEIHYSDSDEITGLSTLDEEIAEAHAAQGWDVREIRVPSLTLDQVWESSEVGARDVHFLKVDVEGAEGDVLSSLDFTRHRPWVVVVEATKPLTTEPSHESWEPLLLEADYQFCLFDGLSRFYVAAERAELASKLSYPACVLDDYTPITEVELHRRLMETQHACNAAEAEVGRVRSEAAALREEQAGLWSDVLTWRSAALDRWAANSTPEAPTRSAEIIHLREEVAALRSSVSWRITEPLRRATAAPRVNSAVAKVLGR